MQDTVPLPPSISGRGPTLARIHEIERILREADGPISVNEIKRRMASKGVDHKMVRLAIDHLGRYGLVVTGSKGVLWVPPASPQLAKAIRAGRRL